MGFENGEDRFSNFTEQAPSGLFRLTRDEGLHVITELETKFRKFNNRIIEILNSTHGAMQMFSGYVMTTRFDLPEEERARFPYSVKLRSFIPRDLRKCKGFGENHVEAIIKVDKDTPEQRKSTKLKEKTETTFSLISKDTIIKEAEIELSEGGFLLTEEPSKYRQIYLIQFSLNGKVESVEVVIDELFEKNDYHTIIGSYVEVEAHDREVFDGFMGLFGQKLGLYMENALPLTERDIRELIKNEEKQRRGQHASPEIVA